MNDWVEEEFATADLGDQRLNERLRLIARRLSEKPEQSVASVMRGSAELHGAYRFFDHDNSSAQKVFAPHREATLLRARQFPRVLMVQDTTELDYTTQKTLKGVGPLAEGPRTGFFAHNHVLFSAEGLALGVWGSDFFGREPEEIGKTDTRKKRPIEDKESQRWLAGYQSACDLAGKLPDTQVVNCSDREGDIFEVFDAWARALEQGGRPAEWLVRSSHNRCMNTEKSPFPKIHTHVAGQPSGGTLSLNVKARVQNKKVKGGSRIKHQRSKRMATLELRWTSVVLKPPYRKDRKLNVIEVHIVRATEINPPEGEDPIDWILLTSLPVGSFEEACEIIRLYQVRWQIEVFHRVLKSGCRVEELQLKDARRVFVAVALYMVVAWRVFYLMKLGRSAPELPCDLVVEEDEWKTLRAMCGGGGEADAKAPPLGWFVKKVAELGGHLSRKGDGPPGAQVLWRGLSRLRDFTLAWQILIKGERPLGATGPF
jgi:hypothetical protein